MYFKAIKMIALILLFLTIKQTRKKIKNTEYSHEHLQKNNILISNVSDVNTDIFHIENFR